MSPPFPIRRNDRARLRIRAITTLVWLYGCLALAAGCATPRAEGIAAGPPLAVPAPPPRALAPVELEATSLTASAPPAVAPEVPSDNGAPAAASSGAASRPAAAGAPAAADPPAASTPPAPEPSREVRVVPSDENPAAEQDLFATINRANLDLSRVVYSRLTGSAKDNYDQARRDLELASTAYRETRNITYALLLAQRSATIAAQLVVTGR